MSIWDSVKPAKKTVTVTSVVVAKDQREVTLGWSDGATTKVGARRLRQYCPCAGCVDEWSGKRTLEIDAVPETMQVLEVNPVGNYALSFTFADEHRTGIYQWQYLRDLSSQA